MLNFKKTTSIVLLLIFTFSPQSNIKATDHCCKSSSFTQKAILYTAIPIAIGIAANFIYNQLRPFNNEELILETEKYCNKTQSRLSRLNLYYENELNILASIQMGEVEKNLKELTEEIRKNGGIVVPFLLFKLGLNNDTKALDELLIKITNLQKILTKRIATLIKNQKTEKINNKINDKYILEFKESIKKLDNQKTSIKIFYSDLYKLAKLTTQLREFKDELVLYRLSEFKINLEKFKNDISYENNLYHCPYFSLSCSYNDKENISPCNCNYECCTDSCCSDL